MINIQELRGEYKEREKTYKILAETVKFSLNQDISHQKIKIHSFIYRIKNIDSLINKIRKKNINKPFEEIHDLVGLRIVCLFLSDVPLIGKIVRDRYRILEEDNKIDDTNCDIFGYMSLHMHAIIEDSTEVNSIDISSTPFEVQIRTIAQDAWASISHYLDYKQEKNIPDQLRRDFHALSGLFYVADTHFSMLRKEQQEYFFREVQQS